MEWIWNIPYGIWNAAPKWSHDLFYAPSLRMDCDHRGAAALAWFTMASASSGRQSKFRHGSSLLFHQLNELCSAGSQWSRLSQMHPNPGQWQALFFQNTYIHLLQNEMFHTNQNRSGRKTKALWSSRSWPRGINSTLLSLVIHWKHFILLESEKISIWQKFNNWHYLKIRTKKALASEGILSIWGICSPSEILLFGLNARDKWRIVPGHWNAL